MGSFVGQELIHCKYLAMMQVGKELVKAGHLPAEDYGNLVLNRPPHAISADLVLELSEAHQVKLVRNFSSNFTWFTSERLDALRGGARAAAALQLAPRLHQLCPD